jgi:hypothetical protein
MMLPVILARSLFLSLNTASMIATFHTPAGNHHFTAFSTFSILAIEWPQQTCLEKASW